MFSEPNESGEKDKNPNRKKRSKSKKNETRDFEIDVETGESNRPGTSQEPSGPSSVETEESNKPGTSHEPSGPSSENPTSAIDDQIRKPPPILQIRKFPPGSPPKVIVEDTSYLEPATSSDTRAIPMKKVESGEQLMNEAIPAETDLLEVPEDEALDSQPLLSGEGKKSKTGRSSPARLVRAVESYCKKIRKGSASSDEAETSPSKKSHSKESLQQKENNQMADNAKIKKSEKEIAKSNKALHLSKLAKKEKVKVIKEKVKMEKAKVEKAKQPKRIKSPSMTIEGKKYVVTLEEESEYDESGTDATTINSGEMECLSTDDALPLIQRLSTNSESEEESPENKPVKDKQEDNNEQAEQ